MQIKMLSAATETQDTNETFVSLTDDMLKMQVPLPLPAQNSYPNHRTVTAVLHGTEDTSGPPTDRSCGYMRWELSSSKSSPDELLSPISTQLLVPPDDEALFPGHQALRACEASQAISKGLIPISSLLSASASSENVTESCTMKNLVEEFEFSPDFNRGLSESENAISELESQDTNVLPKDLCKRSESPQHSDSDLEFFECRQTFSDFSEPEDLKVEHSIDNVSEPLSPMPGSSSDVCFLKGSPQTTDHPFLPGEDYKRLSSGSESLGDFAYDSEESQECPTGCEELPSRDQAGYYDDDDFLGRVRGSA